MPDYLVCRNSQCPGNPKGGFSWRPISKGPPDCKFCGTPFQKGSNGDRRKLQGSPKSSKGKGHGNREPKPESKGKRDDAQQEIPIEVLERHLRKHVSTNADFEQGVDFGVLFPQKDKTPAELRKDAVDAVDKALSQHNHQQKVLSDMRSSLDRKARELMEYQKEVEEQEARAEEAKQAFIVAKDTRDSIDASTVGQMPYAPPNLTTELNKFLSQRFADVQQVPASLAADIAAGINQIVEQSRPTARPLLPPPNHPPDPAVFARVRREQAERELSAAAQEEQKQIALGQQQQQQQQLQQSQQQQQLQPHAANDPAPAAPLSAKDNDAAPDGVSDSDMDPTTGKRLGEDCKNDNDERKSRRRTTGKSLPGLADASGSHVQAALAAAECIIQSGASGSSHVGKQPG